MPNRSICVLFIDDNQEQMAVAVPNLKAGLEEQGIDANVLEANTVEAGIKILERKSLHLIIIDLKIEGGGMDGEELISFILKKKVLPIIVFSGYIDELVGSVYEDHKLIYLAEEKIIKLVVDKIVEWEREQIFDFFREDSFLSLRLREILQDTMWNHLSKYWNDFQTDDPGFLEKTALRIASTLILNRLATASEFLDDSGEVPIHHGEIYLFETNRIYLTAGDIVRIDEDCYIVLTPSCDLVIRDESSKAKEVLLAYCHDLVKYIDEVDPNKKIKNRINILLDDNSTPIKKDKEKKKLEALMHQDYANPTGQYFFLPPFSHIGGFVVDFLKLKVQEYPGNEENNIVRKREISLNHEISSELITRFARYIMRLGQSQYKGSALIESLTSLYDQ